MTHKWGNRKRGRVPSMTLAIDLDQTIIFATTSYDEEDCGEGVEVNVGGGVYFVRKRPYVDIFLDCVFEYFEIVVYTASRAEYAEKIIDQMDLTAYVDRLLSRESCSSGQEGRYLKDLRLCHPSLARVVIIDDTPQISLKDNLIQVPPWLGTNHDNVLLHLIPSLLALRHVKDVRHILALQHIHIEGLVRVFEEHSFEKRIWCVFEYTWVFVVFLLGFLERYWVGRKLNLKYTSYSDKFELFQNPVERNKTDIPVEKKMHENNGSQKPENKKIKNDQVIYVHKMPRNNTLLSHIAAIIYLPLHKFFSKIFHISYCCISILASRLSHSNTLLLALLVDTATT